MKTAQRFPWLLFALAILLVGPSMALAHVGVGSTNGFSAGLIHPITGLDHLCAMIGVGLWAAQRGGRANWLIPLAFLGVMALGVALGAAGVALPLVEQGIVASVLILGVLIAAAIRLPLVASALLVGTFALFHGHAHGAEMPLTASGMACGLGFLAASATLLGFGVALGAAARSWGATWVMRFSGAALVIVAIYLAAS